MKIRTVEVENFRGIDRLKVAGLGDLVVIAGPNGSGKSCIFDAIRLVKSAYGGYQANEYELWMGEFQIDAQRDPWEMKNMLRRHGIQATIKIAVELAASEIEYLRDRKSDLMEETAFIRTQLGQTREHWRMLKRQGRVTREVQEHLRHLKEQLEVVLENELTNLNQTAVLTIQPQGRIQLKPNLALEAAWSTYSPHHIGVMDYHGSHRNYVRENVSNVNLSLGSQEDQQKQHTLYNYGNKYTSIKTEMATEFIHDLLRKERGDTRKDMRRPLENTLADLFRTFFPGKTFKGAAPDSHGGIRFPVDLGGIEHDINELSSGEKEILYGYLRLRKSAPKNSIILLDEPELHLNPKLIQGLPQFYERHLVRALDNQMWLITHSDALLREALVTPGATVLHMQEAKRELPDFGQLKKVEANQDEEHAVMELVGDIAGYRPSGKVVIFEGTNAGFDVKMTTRLFPEYENKMNFIAGGNRAGVEKLHRLLEVDGSSGISVHSIVDRDSGGKIRSGPNRHVWNVYHIENYLLDPSDIFYVIKLIKMGDSPFREPSDVENNLLGIARIQVGSLLKADLRSWVSGILTSRVKIRGDSDADLGCSLREEAKASLESLSQALDEELTNESIMSELTSRRDRLEQSLKSDRWKSEFRGRDILKKFCGEYGDGLKYERFRDMIVNRMRERGHQPSGMRNVLRAIDESS